MLLRPWWRVGQATSTVPASPTASPAARRRDGARRASTEATTAVNSGFAPFSIPVRAEETRCSAKGNMLSGNAIQITPSGDPFVLLVDRYRTAGYAKPAVVHPDDLPIIGQLLNGLADHRPVLPGSPSVPSICSKSAERFP